MSITVPKPQLKMISFMIAVTNLASFNTETQPPFFFNSLKIKGNIACNLY